MTNLTKVAWLIRSFIAGSQLELKLKSSNSGVVPRESSIRVSDGISILSFVSTTDKIWPERVFTILNYYIYTIQAGTDRNEPPPATFVSCDDDADVGKLRQQPAAFFNLSFGCIFSGIRDLQVNFGEPNESRSSRRFLNGTVKARC